MLIDRNSFSNIKMLLCIDVIVCVVQNVEFVRTGYGKNEVKVLFIRREGSHHSVIELKANVELTLKSRKDYLQGDNSDIIPTDTIKNTVHGLAKIKGVGCTDTDTHTDKPVQTFLFRFWCYCCFYNAQIK